MNLPFWFLDSRSLSLFRILLGAVTLYTFAQLYGDAAAFFGGDGIVPPDFAWNGYTLIPWLFTLTFAAPESMALIVGLLAAGTIGALLLLIGRGARVGALLAWWAFGTLAARNPLVLHAGDSLLSIMLLFAAALPTSRHFCWPRKASQPPVVISNFATTLWIAQVGVVYLAAALVKVETPTWQDGSHLELLMRGTESVTAFGRWFGQFTTVVRIGTLGSLVFEFALGIFLLVLPAAWQRLRLWLLAGAIAFHLLIAMTLQVGLFPILSLTAISSFLPALFWERMKRGRVEATAFDLPPVAETVSRKWQVAAAIPVALAVAWIGIANANPAPPRPPVALIAVFHQLQWKNNWNVFAGTPQRKYRLGIEGVVKLGRRMDLLEGAVLVPKQFYTLPSESDRFGGSRWRFFLFGNLVNRPELRVLAPNFLRVIVAKEAGNLELDGVTWELVLYSAPRASSDPSQITREVIGVYRAGAPAAAPVVSPKSNPNP